MTKQLEQLITAENVKNIGESIAVSAMKKMVLFSGNELNDLYRMLVHDSYGKNPDDIYSPGYDIASEVICFLCQYIGKNLTDMVCKDKHGNPITIRHASYKTAYKYIEKERFAIFNHRNIEKVSLANFERNIEDRREVTDEDFDKVDAIINKMQLTQPELETLTCYMMGMQYIQIARYFSVDHSTIWRRRKRIQEKYYKYILCEQNGLLP